MANRDGEICRDFLAGVEPNDKKCAKVRGWNGGWIAGGRNGNGLTCNSGTKRLSYIKTAGVSYSSACKLYSYEQWEVATRLENKQGVQFIVNGDNAPNVTTRQHQQTLRSVLRNEPGLKYSLLPYSALRAASISTTNIKIVATTPDREIEQTVWRINRETKQPEQRVVTSHFLGETLFRVDVRNSHYFYVSGLDRNDPPRRRSFYLALLPQMRYCPKTVELALATLRPKRWPLPAALRDLSGDVLRQGEWFLVPSLLKLNKEQKQAIVNQHPIYSGRNDLYGDGVPILSADADTMQNALQSGPSTFVQRRTRHCATRMHIHSKLGVFVSGMLRDQQHGALKLGDGKQWYRVVRNLAAGSWGATGDVD